MGEGDGMVNAPTEAMPQDRIAATRDLKDAVERLGFELREEFQWDDRDQTGTWRFVVWDVVNEWWADV